MNAKLYRALRQTAEDRRELAGELLETKIEVYVATLEDLAASYGYELPDDGIELSDDVIRALRDEADDSAQSIVDTYNDELRSFMDRQGDADDEAVLGAFETWAARREEHKPEQIAITEAYGPHADATLAFFADNGIEPDFDFGDHGDDDPACLICQALRAANPHPAARVREVGKPHIGCRQSWHPLIDANDLPDELVLGQSTAGLVGAEPYRNGFASVEDAAANLGSSPE